LRTILEAKQVVFSSLIQAGCGINSKKYSGSFNFRPYQVIIALGVINFVHSISYMVYYVLPLNEQQQKYVPGKCLDDWKLEVPTCFVVSPVSSHCCRIFGFSGLVY
jgi:hypothetical protein